METWEEWTGRFVCAPVEEMLVGLVCQTETVAERLGGYYSALKAMMSVSLRRTKDEA